MMRMTMMAEAAGHTAGPWEAIGTDPAEGGDWFWIKAQPNPAMRGFSKEIGVVSGSQSDPVQVANARLIATAPELLEALQWAVDEFDGKTRYDNADQLNNCIDKCRDALAKARGQ